MEPDVCITDIYKEEKQECPICLLEIKNTEIKYQACINKHYFHLHCLYNADKHVDKPFCPLCRVNREPIPDLIIVLLGKQTDITSYQIASYIATLKDILKDVWYLSGLNNNPANQVEFLKFLCIKAYTRDFDGDFFIQDGLLSACLTIFQTMSVHYFNFCKTISQIIKADDIRIFDRKIGNEISNGPYSIYMIRKFRHHTITVYQQFYDTHLREYSMWRYLYEY